MSINIYHQDPWAFWLVTGFMFLGSGMIWRRLLSFLGRHLEPSVPPVVINTQQMCFYMTVPGKEVNEGVIVIAAVCDTDPYSLEEKSESIRHEDRRQMMTPSSPDDTVAL